MPPSSRVRSPAARCQGYACTPPSPVLLWHPARSALRQQDVSGRRKSLPRSTGVRRPASSPFLLGNQAPELPAAQSLSLLAATLPTMIINVQPSETLRVEPSTALSPSVSAPAVRSYRAAQRRPPSPSPRHPPSGGGVPTAPPKPLPRPLLKPYQALLPVLQRLRVRRQALVAVVFGALRT